MVGSDVFSCLKYCSPFFRGHSFIFGCVNPRSGIFSGPLLKTGKILPAPTMGSTIGFGGKVHVHKIWVQKTHVWDAKEQTTASDFGTTIRRFWAGKDAGFRHGLMNLFGSNCAIPAPRSEDQKTQPTLHAEEVPVHSPTSWLPKNPSKSGRFTDGVLINQGSSEVNFFWVGSQWE